MRYAAQLAALPTAGGLVTEPVAHRAVLLTGQSSYRHSQLSPAQASLLQTTEAAGFSAVTAGFPYHEATLRQPYRPEPLAAASARNAHQFAAALCSTAFRHQLGRHLQPLVDRTGHVLLVVAGSSGMHLWASALPRLMPRAGQQVVLLALGPVAPAGTLGRLEARGIRVHVVQGRSDRVSRLGHRDRVDTRVAGGHLDYAADPAVHDALGAVATACLGEADPPARSSPAPPAGPSGPR